MTTLIEAIRKRQLPPANIQTVDQEVAAITQSMGAIDMEIFCIFVEGLMQRRKEDVICDLALVTLSRIVCSLAEQVAMESAT